jgi:putative mRNA 3-end processing factor
LNLKAVWSRGVIVEYKGERIHLDPSNPKASHLLISHAHSDHTGGFKAEESHRVYSTKATAAMFEAVSGRKPKANLKLADYAEKFKVGSFKIEVFNSGHIFGSAGFQVEVEDETLAYTGDLNFTDTVLTEAAEPVNCDHLIIEATYGNPAYRFPSREKIYREIISWTVEKIRDRKIPVFYVYPVGKAQEIIKLLNQYTELEIFVHPKIDRVNKVHERFGVKLEAEPLEGKISPGRCVLIYPRRLLGSLNLKDQIPVLATGWAVRGRWIHQVFPLSSHGDHHQLLDYVKACKPSRVYTCFGFDETLASTIRRQLGINAKPLPAERT